MASLLPFEVAPYLKQVKAWPGVGQHILAHYNDQSIIVYQAYNDSIADAALKANNFHSDTVVKAGYNVNRMSWIKTNFLWMMYRSGWASKHRQERILAIRISRDGFEEILRSASTKGEGTVRLQWDPDHTPSGEKTGGRRAIQLGLRREMLDKFSREFIINIHDITDFVKKEASNCFGDCDSLLCPVETVYVCTDDAGKNVGVD